MTRHPLALAILTWVGLLLVLWLMSGDPTAAVH
jgi:hypothetical protein